MATLLEIMELICNALNFMKIFWTIIFKPWHCSFLVSFSQIKSTQLECTHISDNTHMHTCDDTHTMHTNRKKTQKKSKLTNPRDWPRLWLIDPQLVSNKIEPTSCKIIDTQT
jgi:hypothetical protein